MSSQNLLTALQKIAAVAGNPGMPMEMGGMPPETAAPTQAPDKMTTLQEYLAFAHFLSISHHVFHWVSKGMSAYGDHLLFERLYSETDAELDMIAEKAIGQTMDDVVAPMALFSLMGQIAESHLADVDVKGGNPLMVRKALELETTFINMTKSVYDSLKESDQMTLGLDDMLMNIANTHEGHAYLLKQRIKSV
jgi:DNA-binding ferritin-like protein